MQKKKRLKWPSFRFRVPDHDDWWKKALSATFVNFYPLWLKTLPPFEVQDNVRINQHIIMAYVRIAIIVVTERLNWTIKNHRNAEKCFVSYRKERMQKAKNSRGRKKFVGMRVSFSERQKSFPSKATPM